MKRNLFGNHIEPNCNYCTNNIGGETGWVCRCHLVPGTNGECRKFSYDPLLRTPESSPVFPDWDFDKEDFSI